MASTSLLYLALIVALGQVNCQRGGFGGRNEEQIADGCENKIMDIFFVLDSSSSIYINDYRTELQFARDVVARFDVRQDATRVGALTFSDDYQRPALGLQRFNSRQDAMASMNIQNLPYRTGVTNTDLAIRYVNELNDFKQDITKVIVVVTDGGSRSPGATAAEADRARANGFYVFVVGVGQYLDEREWRAIANDPDENFLFNITNYRFLDSVKYTLPPRACSLPPIILRETCETTRPAELYFVAARSASDEAVQLIDYFKENTMDESDALLLNYYIDICDFAIDIPVDDEREICDRFAPRIPQSPEDVNNLVSRARNAARESRSVTGRPQRSQTMVLFVDDNTMASSGSIWSQELSVAQQFDNIKVIVVDLGLRTYRGFLNRLTQNRGDIIPYLGGSLFNQRETRNNMVERTCIAVNSPPGFDVEPR